MLTPDLDQSKADFEFRRGTRWELPWFLLENRIGQSILTLAILAIAALVIYLAASW